MLFINFSVTHNFLQNFNWYFWHSTDHLFQLLSSQKRQQRNWNNPRHSFSYSSHLLPKKEKTLEVQLSYFCHLLYHPNKCKGNVSVNEQGKEREHLPNTTSHTCIPCTVNTLSKFWRILKVLLNKATFKSNYT